ncbi:MAG: hypothetical protein KatS3mg102_2349 [Planctomycetota bacterium]|nr:MAG: hypothetical protein KatS3mg102_2349 [Planctomycetota bacterium]
MPSLELLGAGPAFGYAHGLAARHPLRGSRRSWCSGRRRDTVLDPGREESSGGRHTDRHRQPHRQALRVADRARHDPRHRPPADQGGRGRLRPDELRPGLHEHRLLPSRITFIDGDAASCATAAIPSSSWPRASTFLEVAYLLVHGELPTRPARRVDARDHAPHLRARERQGVHAGLPLRRAPDGHARRHASAALSTFYPEAQGHPRSRGAAAQIVRPDRQDAHAGGLGLPPHHGQPFVYPDNELSLHRQLPGMLFKTGRAAYEAQPACSSARWTCCSSCTPTTSRTARPTRCAASAARQADPYSALAAGIAALYGPLHGGANEAVLRMLAGIGSVTTVPDFIEGSRAARSA